MHERRPGSSPRPADDQGREPGPLARSLGRLVVGGAEASARLVTRMLGTTSVAGRPRLTGAELRELIAASTGLPGEERRIIREVITAGTRHVREVMVPRPDVLFLQADQTITAAARMVGGGRHSRFPVVEGSADEVIGFVHLRDLLIRPEGDVSITVGDLAREVKRLPGSKRVLAALSEMRREGRHLAVVVDEYGGTAGIVTLEDLIEELIGEIHDEYDPAPELPADGAVPPDVDGRLNLADFAEATGVTLPSGPYETLGGYLMARLGRMPAVGDEVVVEFGAAPGDGADPTTATPPRCRLVVTALDGRRVDRVALVFAGQPVPAVPGQAAPAHPRVGGGPAGGSAAGRVLTGDRT